MTPMKTLNLTLFATILSLMLAPLDASATETQAANGKAKMVDLWSPGDSGQRMRIRGRVTTLDGTPVPNLEIFFRHADSEGIDWSYHRGYVTTNDKGIYQFGSVIPGNSHRLSHVHVYIDHPEFEYLDTEFYFKDDPKVDETNPNAIFLEEGTVSGETMMFGRYDILLVPR